MLDLLGRAAPTTLCAAPRDTAVMNHSIFMRKLRAATALRGDRSYDCDCDALFGSCVSAHSFNGVEQLRAGGPRACACTVRYPSYSIGGN